MTLPKSELCDMMKAVWYWPAVHLRTDVAHFNKKKQLIIKYIRQCPHNYYHLVAALWNAVCLPVAAVKYISTGSAACLLLEFLWHLTTTIFDLWHTSCRSEHTPGALTHNGGSPCQGRATDYYGAPVNQLRNSSVNLTEISLKPDTLYVTRMLTHTMRTLHWPTRFPEQWLNIPAVPSCACVSV